MGLATPPHEQLRPLLLPLAPALRESPPALAAPPAAALGLVRRPDGLPALVAAAAHPAAGRSGPGRSPARFSGGTFAGASLLCTVAARRCLQHRGRPLAALSARLLQLDQECHWTANQVFVEKMYTVKLLHRDRIHKSTISLRFQSIILIFFRLEVSTFGFGFLKYAIHE